MKWLYIILLFINVPYMEISAQNRKGVIVDKGTQMSIPFATVSYGTHDGRQMIVMVDAQGQFSIPDTVRQMRISCIGYKAENVDIETKQKSLLIVELEELTYAIDEVVVTPKNNPAIRIIRNALANRDRNNHELYDEYKYRNYIKVNISNKQIHLPDTAESGVRKGGGSILISETITTTTKTKGKVQDNIIANRSIGSDSPLLGQSMFVMFHKAISFYSGSISIFGEDIEKDMMKTKYVGPLSAGCLNAYNYQLENVYFNGIDTVFEISYFPKKHAGFESFVGTMFINSDGYAIESITAQPYDKGLISFKFKQEYTRRDGKWFPYRLEEELGFSQYNNSFYAVKSIIDSVSFNVGMTAEKHFDRIFIDNKSLRNSLSILDNTRPDSLTTAELNRYAKIDSALRKWHIGDFINIIPKLNLGKLPIGKVDIDLPRLYTNNTVEGSRLGFGMHTNELMNPYISIGAYGGYGTKDRKMKYGGELDFTLNRTRTAHLILSHQNTLKSAGAGMNFNFVENYNLALSSSLFEYCVENMAEGSFHLARPLRVSASLSAMDITPAYKSTFNGKELTSYKADAVRLSARYAVGEEHTMMLDATRMVTSIGNPVFTATYTRGVNFMRRGSLPYNKLEASVDIIAYNGLIGQSNIKLQGGYIDRPLPYGMMFTGEGSYSNNIFSIVTGKSFQTMRSDEFLSDRYIHLFYRHNFGSLLFKKKSLRPELSVIYNTGWGDISSNAIRSLEGGIDYKIKNKIYQEGGLIIDNIVRLPLLKIYYLRLGAGGFLRLGYYRLERPADNLTVKASLTFYYK